MAAIDQTGNSDKEICWARGDTKPRVFTIRDSAGVALDISGSTFKMTVNTDKDPSVAVPGTELFSVAGTFVTDGTNGQVQFAPTPVGWADGLPSLPTTVFYDIEETDGATAVDTLIKGKVKIIQDVSK
jgi:hypothetical protein